MLETVERRRYRAYPDAFRLWITVRAVASPSPRQPASRIVPSASTWRPRVGQPLRSIGKVHVSCRAHLAFNVAVRARWRNDNHHAVAEAVVAF